MDKEVCCIYIFQSVIATFLEMNIKKGRYVVIRLSLSKYLDLIKAFNTALA